MRRLLRENGLSIVLFALFFLSLLGQVLAGHGAYNHDRREHGKPEVGYATYVGGAQFAEALFENWESEFLQMAAFVMLTVILRQKGSPESKKLEGEEDVDADPRDSRREDAPWPVKRGGWVLSLYENSLTLALFLLFALSFGAHAWGSVRERNEEALEHGGSPTTLLEHLGSSALWFESFQNWQSEFLSVGVLIVLSIFLRQRGSSESKPVDHPHAETGRE